MPSFRAKSRNLSFNIGNLLECGPSLSCHELANDTQVTEEETMPTGRVRVGLIGCGKISRTHATALAALEEAEFVTCCDRDEGRAQELAAAYGVAGVWSDAGDMIRSGSVDAVLV